MTTEAATAAATGLDRVLFEAFIIYAAAKVAGQLAEQIRMPSLVGELLAGMAIGPAALGWIHLGEFQEVLAELGVIFLLFTVGLETRFSDLRAVGPVSLRVGILGVVLPFALGWASMKATGYSDAESLFMGTALVATSVGITAKVLSDLGRLREPAGRAILGAAVIDDVLGLALLAVVSGAAAGTLSGGRVAATLATSIAFIVFLAVAGTRLMRRYPRWLEAALPARSPVVVAIMICLGLSAAAARVGLAAIVGAFLAGMVLAEAREQYELDRQITPVTNFLTPFFFAVTGAKVNVEAFTTASAIGLVALLTVAAVAGKVGGGWLGARGLAGSERAIVGVGMVPRGEVGIIVASVGLAGGTIDERLYAVAVAVALLTTIAAPPWLQTLSGPPRI